MKKVSIIIPVFNEEKTVLELLRRVRAVNLKPLGLEKEIIVVDDASTDGTRGLLQNEKRITLSHNAVNKGKGYSVRKGLEVATGDFALIQDADLEYDPEEYPTILSPLVHDHADVVYGSRFVGSRPHRVLHFWHYAGNRFLTTFSNILTNLNLTDMETCYKSFNRKAIDTILPELTAGRFGIEPEITARVAQNKLRIMEVGISYYGRTYTEGKKIGWKDGVAAIWHIIKYNLF